MCVSESKVRVLKLAIADPLSAFPLAFAKTGFSFVMIQIFRYGQPHMNTT